MPAFLVAVFVLTFGLQLPALFVLPSGSLPAMMMLALAGMMPGLVALVAGRGRVRPPDGGSRPRVLWPAAVALLMPIAMPLAAGLVVAGFGGGALETDPFVIDAAALYVLLVAPIFEELGWRGWLQPRLDDAHRRTGRPSGRSVAIAGALVGVIWAVWHLPMSIASGGLARWPLAAVQMVATSIWIGALYELSGRRVWVAMLAHFAINLAPFHAAPGLLGTGLTLGLNLAAAALTVAALGIRSAPADSRPC